MSYIFPFTLASLIVFVSLSFYYFIFYYPDVRRRRRLADSIDNFLDSHTKVNYKN